MSDNKIGLALSGGGYRATLYALGALCRLNEFGILKNISTITSVSGGSITSAYLALHWDELTFDANGVATNFMQVIAEPLFHFCSIGIDVKAGLTGLFSFRDTIGDKIAKAYDKHLYKRASIQDIPASAPEMIFYGTNYQTGSSLRIQKSRLYDYKIGEILNPDIPISKAVGISSAFPPVLSPVTLKLDPESWVPTQWSTPKEDAYKSKLILTDGGLYDNLGIEAIWKQGGGYDFVLVCDAGAPLSLKSQVRTNWIGQYMRMTDIMIDQQRAVRKRMLISNFEAKDGLGNQMYYDGTYFGISTKIDHYGLSDAMARDSAASDCLKMMRTRLNPFTEAERSSLVNWGYAVTDAAIRRHVSDLVLNDLNRPGSWPYPDYPL